MDTKGGQTEVLIVRASKEVADLLLPHLEAEARRFRVAPNGDGRALSKREAEILTHVADGLTNAQIARALYISYYTVKTHVERAKEKLGTHSRAQAASTAIRLGMID
jgi:DNA-binding NarL/FixJ family response regulator